MAFLGSSNYDQKKLRDIEATIMSAVGFLVFCTDCGNLLDSSTGNTNAILVCECCGAENKGMLNFFVM